MWLNMYYNYEDSNRVVHTYSQSLICMKIWNFGLLKEIRPVENFYTYAIVYCKWHIYGWMGRCW